MVIAKYTPREVQEAAQYLENEHGIDCTGLSGMSAEAHTEIVEKYLILKTLDWCEEE